MCFGQNLILIISEGGQQINKEALYWPMWLVVRVKGLVARIEIYRCLASWQALMSNPVTDTEIKT